jgi:hypothetical protein
MIEGNSPDIVTMCGNYQRHGLSPEFLVIIILLYTRPDLPLQAEESYRCYDTATGVNQHCHKAFPPFLLSTFPICASFISYFYNHISPGEVNVQFHYQEIHRQQE